MLYYANSLNFCSYTLLVFTLPKNARLSIHPMEFLVTSNFISGNDSIGNGKECGIEIKLEVGIPSIMKMPGYP
jgi:hypothetical protein